MYEATVAINLAGLEQFATTVDAQLNGTPGPIANCVKLWAVRYRSFAQIRFDLYSRGGGTWQQLASSTMKQRREGRGKKSVIKYAILRDTNTLFTALTPTFVNSPGAIEEQIPFGILCGYGGLQRYAVGVANKTGRATIADIANFHQSGYLPRLPQRKIIVDPPPELIRVMADDMERAMNLVKSSADL